MKPAASGKRTRRLTASTSIEIDAPIDVVWAAMTDLRRYHEWNPFIVAIDDAPADPAIGTRLRLHVRWQDGKTVRSWETLTRLDPPAAQEPAPGGNAVPPGQRTAAMAYEFSSWLARAGFVVASREQTITQQPGGPTVYRTEEAFNGLLGRFVPFANIEDGFRRHARALKQRAEMLAEATGAPVQ